MKNIVAYASTIATLNGYGTLLKMSVVDFEILDQCMTVILSGQRGKEEPDYKYVGP